MAISQTFRLSRAFEGETDVAVIERNIIALIQVSPGVNVDRLIEHFYQAVGLGCMTGIVESTKQKVYAYYGMAEYDPALTTPPLKPVVPPTEEDIMSLNQKAHTSAPAVTLKMAGFDCEPVYKTSRFSLSMPSCMKNLFSKKVAEETTAPVEVKTSFIKKVYNFAKACVVIPCKAVWWVIDKILTALTLIVLCTAIAATAVLFSITAVIDYPFKTRITSSIWNAMYRSVVFMWTRLFPIDTHADIEIEIEVPSASVPSTEATDQPINQPTPAADPQGKDTATTRTPEEQRNFETLMRNLQEQSGSVKATYRASSHLEGEPAPDAEPPFNKKAP